MLTKYFSGTIAFACRILKQSNESAVVYSGCGATTYTYFSTKKPNKLAGKPCCRLSAYSLNISQLQGFTPENRPANSHVFS